MVGKDSVKFCCGCGRLLDKKWNKHWITSGEHVAEGFCNDTCKKRQERKTKCPKARPKYGPTGYIYD